MGGKGEQTRRKSMWDRIWIRLPAYLICTPVIILVVDTIAAVFLLLILGDDGTAVFSSMTILAIWAAAQVVPLLVPLILVELGNRRRGWAVPPEFCALFVSVFSIALTGTIYGSITIMEQIPGAYPFAGGVPFGVAVILGGCIMGGTIAWALVSPLIRRWAIRNASAKDLAEHF